MNETTSTGQAPLTQRVRAGFATRIAARTVGSKDTAERGFIMVMTLALMLLLMATLLVITKSASTGMLSSRQDRRLLAQTTNLTSAESDAVDRVNRGWAPFWGRKSDGSGADGTWLEATTSNKGTWGWGFLGQAPRRGYEPSILHSYGTMGNARRDRYSSFVTRTQGSFTRDADGATVYGLNPAAGYGLLYYDPNPYNSLEPYGTRTLFDAQVSTSSNSIFRGPITHDFYNPTAPGEWDVFGTGRGQVPNTAGVTKPKFVSFSDTAAGWSLATGADDPKPLLTSRSNLNAFIDNRVLNQRADKAGTYPVYSAASWSNGSQMVLGVNGPLVLSPPSAAWTGGRILVVNGDLTLPSSFATGGGQVHLYVRGNVTVTGNVTLPSDNTATGGVFIAATGACNTVTGASVSLRGSLVCKSVNATGSIVGRQPTQEPPMGVGQMGGFGSGFIAYLERPNFTDGTTP